MTTSKPSFSPGLEGVPIAESALSLVEGMAGRLTYRGHALDCIPLPHPSGASPWHRMEPGKTLLRQALALVAAHPAVRGVN